MPILEVKHINKSFGSTRVLDDISFSLDRGKALAIIGSSGSGKTTLLRCLNFLETPNAGQIIVNGETLFEMCIRDRVIPACIASCFWLNPFSFLRRIISSL